MKSEKEIQDEIRVALAEAGCISWRNNQGIADYNGKKVRYGVGHPGGSDLIGLTADGIFFAIEVKTERGRVSPDQENFLRAVRRSNGRSGVARNVTEAMEIIRCKEIGPEPKNTLP